MPRPSTIRAMASLGRILCLHYVAVPGAPPRRLALTHDELRALVARERANGFRAGTLDDAMRDPGTFALTFDDAHRSLYTEALPLLRALDVPATVFVPSGSVGMSNEFLTWDEMREMRDAGWHIGSHTVRHPRMSWRLYDEDTAALRARLRDECEISRTAIERALGIPVRDFAFPYGETTPAAREAVAAAGYTRAFTVRESLEWDDDPLAIPRIDGAEAHGHGAAHGAEHTRISVVIPACDRHDMLREIVARWSAQSYPRNSFEVIVVDDGSRSSLRPCLEGAAPNIRLVENAGDPSTFRAGHARQRGADEAHFDTLAFLDADIAVGRDFLWHLDWIHRRVPDAVVLGYLSGYNLHDIGFTHGVDDLRGHADPDEALAIIPDRSREPTLRACMDNLDWLDEPWRLAYTGNLSLTKRTLERVGGFAKEFSGWGLEDLDLGFRLHRGGARFVFSRFAVGHHLLDANEGPPRNPFRAPDPTRDRFAGYEKNLATLAALHRDDPAVARFVDQAHADIDETCGKPDTVGVEFGGACALECAFHRRIHRCQPGGIDTHELMDRLAYATKVGARALYLLGGEPADHPGFLAFVRAASAAGIRRIAVETTALPFAHNDLARAARQAGVDHAVLETFTFDAGVYDAVTRTTGRFPEFLAAIDRLRDAGIHCTARLVVTSANLAVLGATLAELEARDLEIDEAVVLDPAHRDAVASALGAAGHRSPLLDAPRT